MIILKNPPLVSAMKVIKICLAEFQTNDLALPLQEASF